MPRFEKTLEISASAERAWEVIGDLTLMGALAGATEVNIEEMRRVCTFPGGAVQHERISDYSPEQRSYSYAIEDGPLPVKNNRGRFAMKERAFGEVGSLADLGDRRVGEPLLHRQADRGLEQPPARRRLSLSRAQGLPSHDAARAIAVGEVRGAAAALALVDELDLDNYHPFHAARADLLRRLGRTSEAAAAYERAAAMAPTDAERDFLRLGGRGSR